MKLARLLGSLLIAYAAACGLAMFLQDRLIFFPTKGGRVLGPGVDVELRAQDGTRLHARYIEKPGAERTLLYFHGNAGNLADRSDLLEMFTDFGAHVFALEYRGYGRSEGEPSERGIYQDANAAYAWVLQRASPASVVLFGESLGGGVACELASKQKVGGVILLSTFTSIADMAARSFPWLPVRWLVTTKFDNAAKIAKVRAPKLFVHSRFDEVVPFEMSERLFELAAEPKRALWLDRGGHNETFYFHRSTLSKEVRAFLRTLEAPR